jgi:bifunctional non-homologous end joining protein LigD
MMSKKVIEIEGHKIECAHLNKILFPKSGIRKNEVISYYEDIAPIALPFYENHPLTMLRCPDGIEGESFIQKSTPSYFPKWIERHKIVLNDTTLTQTLVNNKAIFVYLANQACITFHLGLSKIDKIKYPSYLIFDLDPSSEDIGLLKNVVGYVKTLLEHLNVKAFLQTTGSRGFHIYVPLKREFTFNKTHAFAKKFANYLAHEYPQDITIAQSKKMRGKKVFIDYARNAYGLNNVAPYSLRAKEHAPIATPLHWEELEEKNLTSQSYNIKNIFKRLGQIKDPWAEMLHQEASLKLMQEKLNQLIDRKKDF